MKKDAANERPKPDASPANGRAPLAQDLPHARHSGRDVPLHVLPVAALHPSPPGQPDQEAIEAGFDNMPV